MKHCALMNCELPDDSWNLKEIIEKHPNKEVENQARILISLGFKETDYFCNDCFWK